MDKISIFWFRRDLRIDDNHGLLEALQSGRKILPIFIFDKNILDKLPKKDARLEFIHSRLSLLHKTFQEKGGNLSTFYSTPIEAFETLTEKFAIENVYTNKDYEPYALDRDHNIEEFLFSKGIGFKSFKDHVIFEEKEVVKDDGNPYKVYTPYSKKWLAKFKTIPLNLFPSEEHLDQIFTSESKGIHSMSELGFEPSGIKIPDYDVSQQIIDEYEAKRNFPAVKGTSKLGLHLRFGSYSTRKAVQEANKSENITFLKELIWREFFIQILWHYPHTVKDSFKPQYDRIEWRNNEEDFKRWCEGKTGYPLVDAGMRELNKTGFMHNRVRMLVGSFLCKHLLIDWRWGEAYFAEKLLDFELSSNVGNWQWVAGCGVDAAPYFRIFNPTTQIKKFDKELKYIKKWVPEFQELTYAKEMVDHKFARERCLTTYKNALNADS
ncbi:cryptochrome/photolyase family protein [Tenacibaculum jejuense]|uniref:Deoxyribodipyrimidine photo-lyase n=1 Tax=Tenacibaculum jejuense TaxID=584609 RepID=A0A238U4Y3_9FLAO|nr:deoxyribodipyrimidine photo-lyase [Tenacibaculum jejuense]SNR14263.1 Deoxyribodipyrimidine photo-lyase [Tenacibaculum jejuense]